MMQTTNKVIGYRNTVPGDETTALIPVMELTPEETVMQLNIKELGRIVHDLRNQLQAAELRRRAAAGRCQHLVFEDTAGMPYDSRHCVICGQGMGLV